MQIDFKKPKKIFANQALDVISSRVVRLDVFSEVFEVVWSDWMF